MWQFLMEDIVGLAASWDLFDLIAAILMLVWFTVLLMPLKGVERRDPVVALTYLLFMLASGAILGYAATPYPVTESKANAMISTFLICASITLTRFYFRRSKIVIATPLFAKSEEKVNE